MDAAIGLRKSTASGGLEDGSQRMWLFHTVTLPTELSHGNRNPSRHQGWPPASPATYTQALCLHRHDRPASGPGSTARRALSRTGPPSQGGGTK